MILIGFLLALVTSTSTNTHPNPPPPSVEIKSPLLLPIVTPAEAGVALTATDVPCGDFFLIGPEAEQETRINFWTFDEHIGRHIRWRIPPSKIEVVPDDTQKRGPSIQIRTEDGLFVGDLFVSGQAAISPAQILMFEVLISRTHLQKMTECIHRH